MTACTLENQEKQSWGGERDVEVGGCGGGGGRGHGGGAGGRCEGGGGGGVSRVLEGV